MPAITVHIEVVETASIERNIPEAIWHSAWQVNDVRDDKPDGVDGGISMQTKLWNLICLSRVYTDE